MMRVSHTLWALMLPLMMAACAGGNSSKAPEVENPYQLRAATKMHHGRDAMAEERWQAAELAFSHALLAAQLADDIPMSIKAWYNLGLARSARNQNSGAEEALNQAILLAGRHQDAHMQMRATLALALHRLRNGAAAAEIAATALPETLFSGNQWPLDIQLQAARLAQRLHKESQATSAYESVIQRSRSNRPELKMRAESHMGLALLARDQNDVPQALSQATSTLTLCHQIGAPRLTAHALLLLGQLGDNPVVREDQLMRALEIYTSLSDKHGMQQSLKQLLHLYDGPESSQKREALQLRLQQLEAKLGQSEVHDATAISGQDVQ